MFGIKLNKCFQKSAATQAFKQTVQRTIAAGSSAYSFLVPTSSIYTPYAVVSVTPIIPTGFDAEDIDVKVVYIENDPDGSGIAKAIITNNSDTDLTSIDLLVSFTELAT